MENIEPYSKLCKIMRNLNIEFDIISVENEISGNLEW